MGRVEEMKLIEEIDLVDREFHFKVIGNGVQPSFKTTGRVVLYLLGIKAELGSNSNYLDYLNINATPKPLNEEIPVLMVSDSQGFFGCSCPKCKSYFRVAGFLPELSCPYCLFFSKGISFLTENQLEYIKTYGEQLLQSSHKKQSFYLKVSGIRSKLTNNTAKWHSSDLSLQTLQKCQTCNLEYDVLGEYSNCPKCEEMNTEEVVRFKLNAIRLQINQGDIEQNNHQISTLVSLLETSCKWYKDRLLILPFTAQRRKEIGRINFQRIFEAQNLIDKYFGINLFEGLSETELDKIRYLFGLRHLIIHNGGVVDEKFLKEFPTTTFVLRQGVTVSKSDLYLLVKFTANVNKIFHTEISSIS